MKANELMIDDYVYNHRNWECPVVEIHKNSAIVIAKHYEEEEFLLSDLRPIPLTPEILEKNGFEVTRNMSSSRNKDVWSLRVSKYKIFHITEHHNKKMFPYFWIEIGSNSDIKYVHQLQHALRLCGIEKTIEL